VNQAEVWLADQHVGRLWLTDDFDWWFEPRPDWLARPDRRILGMWFETHPQRRYHLVGHPHPWFLHLLPEGALRGLISRAARVEAHDDVALLAWLGRDLLGAVRVLAPEAQEVEATSSNRAHAGSLRFAISGVHLKVTANEGEDERLSLPAVDGTGEWIVKLPAAQYRRLPEIEAATMAWARACGVETAACQLRLVTDIAGMDNELLRPEPSLLVRRFDRPSPGERLHFEDAAQVLGRATGEAKYYGRFEEIAVLSVRFGGDADLQEFIRRLVHVVASGNGDAHLKNWAFWYPGEGRHPRLAPAYDLVSTLHFKVERTLWLTLSGSARFEDVALASFDALADRTRRDRRQVRAWVQDAVARTLTAWTAGERDFGYTEPERARIAAHQQSVPLLSGR
jgi:HipA-like protein